MQIFIDRIILKKLLNWFKRFIILDLIYQKFIFKYNIMLLTMFKNILIKTNYKLISKNYKNRVDLNINFN